MPSNDSKYSEELKHLLPRTIPTSGDFNLSNDLIALMGIPIGFNNNNCDDQGGD